MQLNQQSPSQTESVKVFNGMFQWNVAKTPSHHSFNKHLCEQGQTVTWLHNTANFTLQNLTVYNFFIIT